MTAKHSPATALPLRLRSHEASKDGLNIEMTYEIVRAGVPLDFTEHLDAVSRLNAYPQLVQALREAADNLTYRGGNERAEAYRALLRSLGEAE